MCIENSMVMFPENIRKEREHEELQEKIETIETEIGELEDDREALLDEIVEDFAEMSVEEFKKKQTEVEIFDEDLEELNEKLTNYKQWIEN